MSVTLMRRILLSWCIVVIGSAAPAALADSFRLFGNWTYTATESEVEERDTGAVSESETERLRQSYRLDLSKGIFPNFTVNGGAQVEKEKFTLENDGLKIIAREQEVRPYIDAELGNRFYSLTGGYRERRVKNTGTQIDGTVREFIDSYNLRALLQPVDLPSLEVSYFNTKQYDEPLTVDQESETFQFNTRFEYRKYEFIYDFLRSESENKLVGLGSETTTHNGRVRYRNSYLDGRVSLSSRLRAEYTDQSFTGTGPRDFDVFPGGSGFYFIDDDSNPNNNLATDYTQAADFGSILDLNGGDIIDVGLSFDETVTVDMLQLNLSTELDNNTTIDQPANWAVYASADQETWQALTVNSVVFEPDGNLLEIRFGPRVEQEFFLIVYTPPLVTNQVGPVNVSSIRAFITQDLSGGTRLATRAHNFQTLVGWQATEKTDVNYNLNVQQRENDVFDEEFFRVSNGVNLQHRFNTVFTASGRFYVVDIWEQDDHQGSDYSYSARLNGDYLPTLRQSLVYSGNLTEEPEGDTTTDSLILNTRAKLYEGWNVSFDQSYTQQDLADGGGSESFSLRLNNSIAPHRRLTLTADYSIVWNETEGEEKTRNDTGRFGVAWSPIDTLSLSGTIRLRRDEISTETAWDYSVSWLPFRDGDLQLNLSYFEGEDTEDNRTRNASSSMVWQVTHYSTLRLVYSWGEVERIATSSETQTLQADFRIYFN